MLEMLLGVQTGNGTPHDKYNLRGIAHAHTNRKDNLLQLHFWGIEALFS